MPAKKTFSLALPAAMDSNIAAGLRATVGKAKKSPAIEASSVESIGAIGVQLLVSARRELRAKGLELLLAAPSDMLLETLAGAGCEPFATAPHA